VAQHRLKFEDSQAHEAPQYNMGLPPRPASAGYGHPQVNGRKLAFADRIIGTVEEWSGSWGWIVPMQQITHPMFRGKLYAHRRDVKCSPSYMGAGSTVDFLLYADQRGLGAGDIREADAGVAPPGQDEVNAAKVQDSLPPGWEKHWSCEHSEYYYWNKATKETSWVPPEASEGDEAEEYEDDGDLPDGWSENFDPETKATYYWHAPSKTTTWEKPRRLRKKEAPADDDEENEQQPEMDDVARQNDADEAVIGQQRVKGRVDKWQGFFGWILPTQELSAELKPLLENREAIYCNWRDVEAGVTLKVGSLVDFLLYADDNGLGASSVRLQKEDDEAMGAQVPKKGAKRTYQKDDMLELERQWKKQDAELAVGAEEEAEAKAVAEPVAGGVVDAFELEDAPLLPGWEQVWSEESACFYYWHKKSKMSSWERPCVPGSATKKKEKVWEGEGAEEGAARLATPITPVGKAKAGQDITPLTPGGEDAAKANAKQPTAAFRAAQASGAFRGRGWQNGGKGQQEQAPNPFLKRQAPAAWAQGGKGGWMAVKRQQRG